MMIMTVKWFKKIHSQTQRDHQDNQTKIKNVKEFKKILWFDQKVEVEWNLTSLKDKGILWNQTCQPNIKAAPKPNKK